MAKSDDPFLDKYTLLDTTQDDLMEQLQAIADSENPQQPEEVDPETPEAELEPAPAPAPEPAEPRVTTFDDGSTLTVEKTAKGWEAILDTNQGGNPERFLAATKDELFAKIAYGKVHATKKIRELNKELKLGGKPRVEGQQAQTPAAKSRNLSPDEVFEIKNQMQTNPDEALEAWFNKKMGMPIQQLVDLANQGRRAKTELDIESVAKEFMVENPSYYNLDENFYSMVRFLAKDKLGERVTSNAASIDGAVAKLYDRGFWTLDSLSGAFEDLTEAGLLKSKPKPAQQPVSQPMAPAPEVPPAPTPVAQPTQTPSTQGIPANRVPRAGFGTRPNQTRTTLSEPSKPPSAEDYDNLSADELLKLIGATRKLQKSQRQ